MKQLRLKLSYAQQLLTPQWKAKKAHLIEIRGFACEDCGRGFTSKQLQPHHKFYTPNVMAWDYADEVFKLLCSDCHKKTTEALQDFLYILGMLNSDQISDLADALNARLKLDSPANNTVIAYLVETLKRWDDSRLLTEDRF